MLRRMSFRNLKVSLMRPVRHSDSDANGVTTNKAEDAEFGRLDTDAKQQTGFSKTHKTKMKNSRGGIWRRLRRKLQRNNRKCFARDGTESPSEDSDQGFSSGNKNSKQNNKPRGAYGICSIPPPSPFHLTQKSRNSKELEDEINSNIENTVSKQKTTLSAECNSGDEATSASGSSSCKQTSVSRKPSVNCASTDDSKLHEVSSHEYNCSNNSLLISDNQILVSRSVPDYETQHLYDLSRISVSVSRDNPYATPRISLTMELFKLSKYGWYWGPITRTEAEEKLLDQPDGAFLVRDSSDDRYLLSLSFRSYGKTLHTRIEHCNGLFSFYAQTEPEGHTSIVNLIEHSMSYSQSGVFCYSRARSPGSPSFPVRLTKPVSRFTQVRSLQYLCRFIIRQYTRFDHIQKLPLPNRIKGYIEEGHY